MVHLTTNILGTCTVPRPLSESTQDFAIYVRQGGKLLMKAGPISGSEIDEQAYQERKKAIKEDLRKWAEYLVKKLYPDCHIEWKEEE